ncbi:unnamed protein product [Sympodiomycopsis kandeliae]
MPFLSLPESEQHLREADEVQLHYLLSTPSHQTFRKVAETIVTNDIAAPTPLDPAYPVLLVFPSECFSVVHLFPHILADPELATKFNILALDPRGHGLTREVPPRDSSHTHYNLDTKAADCIEAVQILLARTPFRRTEDWKIHVVACGMSGLVATRAAAVLPNIVTLTIVSPILEVEDRFIVDSFEACEDLLTESWQNAHNHELGQARMPGEVVEGFSYRWAGEEELPSRVVKHTFADLLDRWVRRPDGPEAAKAWLFNLYFKRKAQSLNDRNKVQCDMMVLEGSDHLPYEKPMGQTFHASFPKVKSFKYEQIQNSPFLLSVQRPTEVSRRVKKFILSRPEIKAIGNKANTSSKAPPLMRLSHAELYHLRQAFADLDYTYSTPTSSSPVMSNDGQETLVDEDGEEVSMSKIASLPVHRQVQNLRLA